MISVIIPTYNRIERLLRVLAALEAQSYMREQFEVIVVSDGSTDATDDRLRSLETPLQMKALFLQNQGPAAARNLGLAHAAGELALFLDDDVIPAVELIAAHVQAHAALARPAAVFGPMLLPEGYRPALWVAWEAHMLRRQYAALQSGRWQAGPRMFYTGNASIPTRSVAQAGGFDIAFRRAEDVELAFRLEKCGVAFHFAAGAIGYHYAERSYAAWIDTAYAYGRNDVIISETKGAEWLLPTLLQEYRQRNRLVHLLARACLNRPARLQGAAAGLHRIAIAAWRMRLDRAAFFACSGLYNLYYYQGMADELARRGRNFIP